MTTSRSVTTEDRMMHYVSQNLVICRTSCTITHTHTHLTALFRDYLGEPVPLYQKGKTNLDFTEARDTVSGSGISWAICKSAPRSRQITMPAPHRSVFYRPDALPVAQPAASKH